MPPYAAFDERGPLYLAASDSVFDHGNILTNAARCTSRIPCACSTTARSHAAAFRSDARPDARDDRRDTCAISGALHRNARPGEILRTRATSTLTSTPG